MKVRPDIICCEFVGLDAEITKSKHQNSVGASGKIIDETRNTFIISSEGKKKVVAKDSSSFRFNFRDGTIVEIHGRLLVGRPEDRLKKNIRRLW
jgi:ribonuclease P protein subunit POP4